MKKDLLLDIDGVIADLTSYFFNWCAQHGDRVVRTVEDHDHWDWQQCRKPVPKDVEDRFFEEVATHKHCLSLDPYPGALSFVSALQSKFNVIACTATSNVHWTAQRAMWLHCIGIPPRNQIICGKLHKPMIDADFLIEDNVATCFNWVARARFVGQRTAILLDRAYNRDTFNDSDIHRVFSYDHALAVLGV